LSKISKLEAPVYKVLEVIKTKVLTCNICINDITEHTMTWVLEEEQGTVTACTVLVQKSFGKVYFVDHERGGWKILPYLTLHRKCGWVVLG